MVQDMAPKIETERYRSIQESNVLGLQFNGRVSAYQKSWYIKDEMNRFNSINYSTVTFKYKKFKKEIQGHLIYAKRKRPNKFKI